ncbi:hypothetical protein [Actinomadura algeriensis]|uniref:Mce-associated membrane protein n=1 Tax=Actinomadura algeriensis TaxID=1679523 RepID=A0ABR9JMH4_9ACTN|nr:hypothetical protein [Actinomadura algeriensis]MBE1531571.1 Mce-associated membrane protein [Actinomadura algeriensis]
MSRVGGKGSRILVVVLSVAVAGLLAGTGWLGFRVWQNDRDADDWAQVRQSARQMGVNLLTLDSKTGQQDLDRIVSGSTGDLKDELGSQSKVFLDQLNKTKAKSTVTDVEAAVVSIDDDSAEVMVSLNGTVTNEKVKNGVTRAYRYLMQMSKVDDRWLVSQLEMVP